MSNFEFFTSLFDIQHSIFDIKCVKLVTLLSKGERRAINFALFQALSFGEGWVRPGTVYITYKKDHFL